MGEVRRAAAKRWASNSTDLLCRNLTGGLIMFEDSVACQNDECQEYFKYRCEWESMGEGSEHEATCPYCGTKVLFEIEYCPHISNERAA